MDAAHGGYGTSQMPLAGAILCCTSIPPEQRSELGAIGAQMGATIKLDLTSDVTHLIVGNTSSAKYRYVAKAREDVKVLLPEWLDALRTLWMEGDDVDAAALEEQYRLPTFYGLKICLTGFDNPEQRKYIQDTIMQNGAEYHGDLTKSVTHLIAASPTGKKYEHAVNWRMKIVTWEWFEQSRERGMTLDESCYHPAMPLEERGKGAWDRRESTPPMLGKRTRDAGQVELVNPLRRKLRRSASSRMGSQSEALWAGITAGGLERRMDDDDDWTDSRLAQPDEPPVRTSTPQATKVTHAEAQPREDPASHLRRPFSDEHDGIFAGRLVFPHGFDQSKTNILREHLEANGANVIRDASELCKFSSDDLRRGFVVVPHDVPISLVALPEGTGDICLVTNWWVERCLHGKFLVDPTDSVLCRPFDKLGASGFDDLTINSTGFTGIELLHVTKAVALFGATYDEILSPKVSVMICNTRRPNPEKLKFASEKGISTVHATWLWETIQSGFTQPYDNYLLTQDARKPQKSRENSQSAFNEVPTAPLSEENSLKLQQKKAQNARHSSRSRGGPRRPGTLELSLSGPSMSASTADFSTNPNTSTDESPVAHDAQQPGAFDGADSLPLQVIDPSVNSPRQPSTSSNDSSHCPSKKAPTLGVNSVSHGSKRHAPGQRKSNPAKEPTPDSVIPADDPVIPQDSEPSIPQENPKVPEKDYSDIMSKLLANRKTTDPASKEDDKTRRRRRRPLGRVQSTRSNPSTGDDLLSRQSSISRAEEGDEEEVEKRKAFEVPQPSQELGWDSPGAQRAREKMIRAMGGKVEEAGVLEGIGEVKDAKPDTITYGRTTRKRRGH